MFADIVGFTAWSSIRDPAQVFTLLETLYSAFDEIARKRGVFKVETIGDSYVSVCGLPEPREGHAVVMCRFARDCRRTMNEKVRKLEVTLGPDTGDLKVRYANRTRITCFGRTPMHLTHGLASIRSQQWPSDCRRASWGALAISGTK
jgi:class 3 adenylate cyclase